MTFVLGVQPTEGTGNLATKKKSPFHYQVRSTSSRLIVISAGENAYGTSQLIYVKVNATINCHF